MKRLLGAWQEAVSALYLAEEKIEPEVAENMRTWKHSGFSVDQSVFLPAGDQAGIERLKDFVREFVYCHLTDRELRLTDLSQYWFDGLQRQFG
jgi:hypothetical protein